METLTAVMRVTRSVRTRVVTLQSVRMTLTARPCLLLTAIPQNFSAKTPPVFRLSGSAMVLRTVKGRRMKLIVISTIVM